MANAPKNRMEIQVVWPGGFWRIKGPDGGKTWTRSELVAELKDALRFIEELPPEARRGR